VVSRDIVRICFGRLFIFRAFIVIVLASGRVFFVESVGADAVVGGDGVVAGFSLDRVVVGVFWGVPIEGSVGAFGVVGVLKFAQLFL